MFQRLHPEGNEGTPARSSGNEIASYEDHLVFDHVIDPQAASDHERFEALAQSLRNLLTERWLSTRRYHQRQNPKRVYYLSMEFLLGRSLTSNITNLRAEPLVHELLQHEGLDLARFAETEPDAGLGNGGLGRLAACFLDSLATLQIPAIGYGLRYQYDMFPQRFSNKTNGVTPRRWLLLANPALAQLITQAIGDGWIADLAQLRRLLPLAQDASFRAGFRQAKRGAKTSFANWLQAATGHAVDPDSIFDSQIKRIHEYKRQLLNLLHIIILYDRLRQTPKMQVPPHTFFFAGKAAPAYQLAKLIIKLINNVAAVIDAEPAVNDRLKVLFLSDYNVSLAERLIPASDVSEQISTAGYEASGTSNMKFMMNGALTVGTRDGATIEMAQEAGPDNFFLFGLTAEQVVNTRGWYTPHWHYDNEPETRQALDLIAANHFSPHEPGIFNPILDTLLACGDYYMHLADLTSYVTTQSKMSALYEDPDAWARTAILNVGSSGKFSSDRAISEYAAEIWNAKPCTVVRSEVEGRK